MLAEVTALNVKAKTLKFLEEDTGKHFCVLDAGNDFLEFKKQKL